ncbi:MAG: TIGR00268 family protein [Bacteroidota bacterium]|jgi:uncharacterized protein (TIGR00268 family)
MSEISLAYQSLLDDIAAQGNEAQRHLVAFSGGVDSSLVAKAVRDVFPHTSEAVMALSPSVAGTMREAAVALAAHIGIPLRFVETSEHLDPTYIANEGLSCYVCKSSIYAAMESVYEEASRTPGNVLLFNGTNADDFSDPTRVGLQAARDFMVCSPLSHFTKNEVRLLSRHAELPNWDAAASPCLRSRLHIGVPATAEHLHRIEAAENAVRATYDLASTVNFRVRHLPDETAMVEIDQIMLDAIDLDQCRAALAALGFRAVAKRAFRSGSVNAELP